MSSRVATLALLIAACLMAATAYAQQQNAPAKAAAAPRASAAPARNQQATAPRSSAAPAQTARPSSTTPERRSGPNHYYSYGQANSYGYPGSYSDYSNITNRPGAGYVPPSPRGRYPGASYPWSGVQPLPSTTQPLPLGTQVLPGAQVQGPISNTIPSDRAWRRQRRGGAVYYVPYPVYVPYSDPNSYPGEQAGTYTGYDPNVYDNTQPYDPNAPLPQDPNDQQPQEWNGPSRFVDDQGANENVTVIQPSAQSGRPVTLLVFKDHSIYAVTDYWKQGDRVYYVTNYGSQNSVSLDQIDVDFSVRLNGERNVPFELRERP